MKRLFTYLIALSLIIGGANIASAKGGVNEKVKTEKGKKPKKEKKAKKEKGEKAGKEATGKAEEKAKDSAKPENNRSNGKNTDDRKFGEDRAAEVHELNKERKSDKDAAKVKEKPVKAKGEKTEKDEDEKGED